MNPLWSYLWPLLGAGLVIGAVAGTFGLQRQGRQRRLWLIGGIGACIAIAALWHGPLGGSERFSRQVERSARETLDYYEMLRVEARLAGRPLTRNLTLAGPADDFQRTELVRIMGDLPGVGRARWSNSGGVPLIVEALAATLAGFLFGLLIAYLVELRRRHNAQWKW